MVVVWLRGSFFDGFTLTGTSTTPKEPESPNDPGKLFEYGPLAPREERPLTFDVAATTPGDYEIMVTVFVERLYGDSVGTYTGKSVVVQPSVNLAIP
jgi:hypothetical protein